MTINSDPGDEVDHIYHHPQEAWCIEYMRAAINRQEKWKCPGCRCNTLIHGCFCKQNKTEPVIIYGTAGELKGDSFEKMWSNHLDITRKDIKVLGGPTYIPEEGNQFEKL